MLQKKIKLLRYIAYVIASFMITEAFSVCAYAEASSMKGVNTFYTYYYISDEDRNLIYNSGAETFREAVNWNLSEIAEGVYSWSRYDEWFNELNDNGKEIYAVVTCENPPEFYYKDTTKAHFSTQAERTAFCNFLKAFVKKFPFVDYIELWNEPNFWLNTNASDTDRMQCYVDMVKEASKAIREVSSDIEIVGGCVALEDEDVDATTDDGRIDGITFTKYVLPKIYPYVDAFSWHTYAVLKSAESETMQKRIDIIKDEMAACGGWKKIYTSETGWVTGELFGVSVTDEAQAYNIAKVFPVMEENDIDGTLIYNFKNNGEDTSNSEHNFGMVTYTNEPKTSYTYFKDHIAKTKGYTHVGEYSESGKEVHLYVGENDAVKMEWSTPILEYLSNEPSYTENVTLSVAKSLFNDIVSVKYDELSSKATLLGIDISENIQQIKNYITADNENGAYTGNYDLGMELLNVHLGGDITVEAEQISDLLYDIYQIGKRMSAVYDIKSDASDDDILKLERKYDAVENTLVAFDDDKVFLSDAMLNIGRERLNEAKTNVCKKQSGDNYVLSGTGKLKVYGNAPAGSYVSVKITKDGNLIYANTVGADAYNKYEFGIQLNDDGVYGVLLTDASGESNSFEVNRESNFLFEEFIQAEYIVDYARKMLLVTGCDELTAYVEQSEKDGKVYAEFDIQNGAEAQNLYAFLARYNGTVLKECAVVPIDLTAGADKTETLSVTAEAGSDYKVFVWSKNLKPYSTVLESK